MRVRQDCGLDFGEDSLGAERLRRLQLGLGGMWLWAGLSGGGAGCGGGGEPVGGEA